MSARFHAALEAAADAMYGMPFDKLTLAARVSLARAVKGILSTIDASDLTEVDQLRRENTELKRLLEVAKFGIAELLADVADMMEKAQGQCQLNSTAPIAACTSSATWTAGRPRPRGVGNAVGWP